MVRAHQLRTRDVAASAFPAGREPLQGTFGVGYHLCSAESVTVEPGTAATLEVNFLVTTADAAVYEGWWQECKHILPDEQRRRLEKTKQFNGYAASFLTNCFHELFQRQVDSAASRWRVSDEIQNAFMASISTIPQVEMRVTGMITALSKGRAPVNASVFVEVVTFAFDIGPITQALDLAVPKAADNSGDANNITIANSALVLSPILR